MQTHEAGLKPEKRSDKVDLIIVYNGVEKTRTVQPNEAVQAVLQQAIHLFGITSAPHTLSLFRADGTKVDEHQSVNDAGLHDGSVLYLRQDAVKGG